METDNISEEQEYPETIEENGNDSYDELAGEEPPKKGRGRPKGAKNKTRTTRTPIGPR